eukprot:SRR837773.6647.p2 GENE.SRR837773.6647~~SRR837773.6647.p2  ORF type:complete len:270 (+),score=97.16 SRR837773.6647:49-858(+)
MSSVAFAVFGMPTRRPSATVTKALRSNGVAAVGRKQLRDAWHFLSADGNRIMIFMTILGQCVTVGLGAIWYLYLKARFGVGMHEMAKLSAIGSGCFVVVQILVVPALQPIVGLRHMICIGMSFGLLTEFLYVIVPSPSWLILPLITSALASMNGPAVSAMIANLATVGNDDGANAALAAANSVNAISFLVGPLIFNGVFSHFLQPQNAFFEAPWPGAPYAAAMAVSAVALGLLFAVPEELFEKASASRPPPPDATFEASFDDDERTHLA